MPTSCLSSIPKFHLLSFQTPSARMEACNRIGFIFVFTFLVFFFQFSTLCCGENISIGCTEQEKQALLKFKSSFQDPPSHVFSSWEGEACCTWKGVGCDAGHVVKLDLRNKCNPNELHGFNVSCFDNKSFQLKAQSVDPSLQELKYLKYLDLSGNNFQMSQIPSFLGSMKHLRYLNLSNTQFSGEVPHHLGNLTNLQILDLNLKLYGSSLSTDANWVDQLSSLQYIDMSNVVINNSNNLMQVIYKLPALVQVHLMYCQIRSLMIPPGSVNSSTLNKVHVFNLKGNYLSGPLPSALRNMTSIRVLDLSGNNLDAVPLWLGEFKNLVHLNLGRNLISGSIPIALQNMTSMRFLDLSYNYIQASVPLWLAQGLFHINLALNKFTSIESSLQALLRNRCNLKSLYLSRNELHGEAFGKDNLSGCIAYDLEKLDLSYNDFSDDLTSTWLGKLKNLKFLQLASNSFHGSLPVSLVELTNLRELVLGSNQINGTIPASLGRLSSLRILDLSSNKLNGIIPDSLGQLLNLQVLDLSNNSLEGTLSEIHLSSLSLLQSLQVGLNKLTVKLKPDWLPPFKLRDLRLQSSKIETQFPQWLQTQKDLNVLDLTNTGIWGTFPKWFQEMQLYGLYLSNNKINGPLPENIGETMPYLSDLVLANNLINGSIPNSLCKVLANGNLDLSKNQLSGDLPDCLGYANFQYIKLSFNKLSGTIPGSFDFSRLQSLDLSNNKFHGELPSALGYTLDLAILDLGDNQLSGIIPSWIGENPSLQILRLRGNMFHGTIPWSLCSLFRMQILDLADNSLTGPVPQCLGNLIGMILDQAPYNENVALAPSGLLPSLMAPAFQQWENEDVRQVIKGIELDYTRNLKFLINMDLSKNNLSGSIPEGLTFLSGLIGLNLSHKFLSGKIQSKIWKMKSLESIDFSSNQISGPIPDTMPMLTSLGHLNLSHNNLSGPIPRYNQFLTFNDPSSYVGNSLLCGVPLERKCPGYEKYPAPSSVISSEDTHGMEDEKEKLLFYFVVALGYILGFWGVVGVLYFKKKWRYAYFRNVEKLADQVYVATAIRIARLRKMMEINNHNRN